MTNRWRNQFFYVNFGETFFTLKKYGLVRKTTILVWNHLLQSLDIWYISSASRPQGVKNWYQFFLFVKIEYQFFTYEKNRSSPSQMARMRTNSSQLKMRKMWNLSTYFRPPKISKLTIRKFHIFQRWRLHTVWNLRNVKFAVQQRYEIARV